MTHEDREVLSEILQKIAEKIGEGRWSEPKHGIVGDEIADLIRKFVGLS